MPVIRAAQRHIETIETSRDGVSNREEWISEPAGLTALGAFVHVLAPGTRSSIKHWHAAEDEFVYVLEGEVTVIEGTDEYLLGPGDAAAFPQGSAVGHYLWNKSAAAARCLVAGTRAPVDQVTYPDHDRVMLRDRALPDDIWTDTSGNPADNPYKDWAP
ncbi:putative cupin superfamily protein [Duganella sp. 1224]|uniref:cupin domain-containing protein n=1 Tax=Duganella sp. 1224 TaxID=2587052 RepID=UPI0015CD36C8|nr:cupin domain-containing protein [Duganella sp. 1224]NYE59519.1 putative cupin superfamily protein [Duganella sp. 1224]